RAQRATIGEVWTMVSVVLATLLTAGGTAAADCAGYAVCGVEQYAPVPKMTRFANLIAPFVLCANVRSAVPPQGCNCAGCGWSCGCNGPQGPPFWYLSPYSVGGCAIPGWQGFYDCGGVLVAQMY